MTDIFVESIHLQYSLIDHLSLKQSLQLLLSIMDAIIIILLVNQSPLSFRLRLLLSIMDAIIIILLVNQSPLSFRLIIISINHGCNYYYFVGESITIINRKLGE